jgi:hypothetical protein
MALQTSLSPARQMPHFSSPVFPNLTPQTVTTAAAVTYTAAQVLAGMILRDPAGAGRADLFPTAAQLVAGLAGAAVGTTFDCIIRNDASGAFTLTMTTNTGLTLSGTMTIAQSNMKIFKIRFTNVTPGSEAVTIYSLGTAVF